MEQEKILDIAVCAGSILLRFGAETYRVEETINRICKSYGLNCEAFALPTGVFVSVEGKEGISTSLIYAMSDKSTLLYLK